MVNSPHPAPNHFPHYPHAQDYPANNIVPQEKPKDYFFLGFACSIAVFLIVALMLTLLSATILSRWIPEVFLIILIVGGAIASLFGTIVFFERLEEKQQRKVQAPRYY